MQANHEALTWGIEPGIGTQGREQKTVSWLERVPGRQRRVRVRYTFTRINHYDQTDNLLAIQGMCAYEDEFDGHLAMVFKLNGNCVGMWYNARGTGSFCMDFRGDDMAYAGNDPLWPWQD